MKMIRFWGYAIADRAAIYRYALSNPYAGWPSQHHLNEASHARLRDEVYEWGPGAYVCWDPGAGWDGWVAVGDDPAALVRYIAEEDNNWADPEEQRSRLAIEAMAALIRAELMGH